MGATSVPFGPQPVTGGWGAISAGMAAGAGRGGAAGATGSGGYSMPNFTNTTQNDPNFQYLMGLMKDRLNDPEGSTGRAIDLATSKIRDATEGRRSAMKSVLARRGVLGDSSIPEWTDRQLSDQEGRDVAASASGIALQREKDNDAMLLGATSPMAAAAQAGTANQSLALQQWQAAQNAQYQQQRSQLDRYLAQLQALGMLANL